MGSAPNRPAPEQTAGTAHDENIEHPPIGRHVSAEVESSSNSRVLDDAAVECVEQKLRSVPKRVAGVAIGSWARMTFKWSAEILDNSS